ncbi:MAG: DeoR/GlpR family DNA-binding transcription regulator [Clostridium sp.]|uniref:DeoR/GlpR family DNA-binding transcription regulator n=1 Tax=Clostridium sp. TaxID=1506 RepID=UPI003D6CE69D
MLKINRQKAIDEELHARGSILISDMSQKLDCSEETIRRDLKEMEQDKKLTRIHGGAFLPEEYDKSVPIQLRETFFSAEKERMSSYIIKNYIQEDDIIMLDCSTTCLTLAKQLLFSNTKLTIITNSLRICNLFSNISTNKVKLICLGGTLRQRSSSYIGYQTTQALSGYLADKCFISCPAVDMKHGLVDNNLNEGQIRKAYVQQSRQCFLVADHTKFSDKSDIIITGLENLDVVVTNKRLSKKWEQTFQDLNISIDYC